jgi:hypothetical protein
LRAVAARDHLLPIARRARVATPARGCSRAPLPVAERAQAWLWIPPSAAPRGGRSERWKSQRLRACVRPLGNGRRSSQGQAPRPRRSAVWRTGSVGISEAQGTALPAFAVRRDKSGPRPLSDYYRRRRRRMRRAGKEEAGGRMQACMGTGRAAAEGVHVPSVCDSTLRS